MNRKVVTLVLSLLLISAAYGQASCDANNPCTNPLQSCNGGICKDNTGATACSNAIACSADYTCINQECILNNYPQCSSTNPCTSGQTCINNVCIPNTNAGTCSNDASTCPFPSRQKCVGGQCTPNTDAVCRPSVASTCSTQ